MTGLPPPLQEQLEQLLEEEQYGDAAVLLEEHLAQGGERTPAVLVTLADCVYRDALEVMVDQIIPACQRALTLLDEVQASPRPPAGFRNLRGEISRVLTFHLREEAATQAEIHQAQKAGTLTAEQLSHKAYRLWDAGESLQAAELFLQAADKQQPDAAITERARAGFCLAEAGQWDRARPLLQETAEFDWRAAGLWNDRYDSEKAYAWLLLDAAARQDRAGFRDLWERAVRRGDALELEFPSIRPHQERLLRASVDLALPEACAHLIAAVNQSYKRIPTELKGLLDAARQCAAPS
jgi:tetratricopeptide (TPR) repeat protein